MFFLVASNFYYLFQKLSLKLPRENVSCFFFDFVTLLERRILNLTAFSTFIVLQVSIGTTLVETAETFYMLQACMQGNLL